MSKEYNENKMIDGELLFNELIHLIKMLESRKGKWDEEKDGVYLLSMLFSNVITIMSLGNKFSEVEKYETIEDDEYPEWSRDLMKRMNEEFREDWDDLDRNTNRLNSSLN